MPQRHYSKEQSNVTKASPRVILPIEVHTYQDLASKPEQFRKWLDEMIVLFPELFPPGIEQRYTLHDLLPASSRLPDQRSGEDVDEQIRRWGALRISLREMQEELAHLHIGALALSTLNRRLQQVRDTAAADTPLSVPPVLQVDAIWVTQLAPTGAHRLDRKGRRRPVKRRIKRPVFIALGVVTHDA